MKEIAKILFLGLLISVISISCSNSDEESSFGSDSPTNEYLNYDFYIAHKGCGVEDEFSKNFQAIAGFDTAVNFNVAGNSIYTFGAKKYRDNPEAPYYSISDNYSGYLSKNGQEMYSNIGGNSSSVVDVQEVGADVYFVTEFQSQDGLVEASSVICTPKVYKNGILLGSLSGPFNNYTLNSNGSGYIYSSKFGIILSDIIVKNGDIYVFGVCDDFNSDFNSFGYWKNGVYIELKRFSNFSIVSRSESFISDNGDVYYGFSKGGVHLFKNGSDMIAGSLNDKFFNDFGILNNDVYTLATYYENGYRLGIFKNGILDFNYLGIESNSIYKMDIADGRIFISGSTIEDERKMTIFEYKPSIKKLVKIGSTGFDYQGCSAVNILNFQVVKK